MKRKVYRFLMQNFPVVFNQIQHYRLHKKFGSYAYWANIKKPRTFNEKILNDKIFGSFEGYEKYVDKYLVKEFVSKIVNNDIIVPTIALIDHVNQLDNIELKFPCIIKPTHASSRVIICKEAKDFNLIEAKKQIKEWFAHNHYDTSGEPQYKNLKPKVIIEEMLVPANGQQLMDYKIFCFNGKPHFIQVDVDRFQGHKRAIYDTNWNKLDYTIKFPFYNGFIQKPSQLNEMLRIATLLSNPFKFVRVDLYSFDNKIYFGELTFHHGSGYESFSKYEHDLEWGSLMKM